MPRPRDIKSLDIDDIKNLNRSAGFHFFDASTLRFFRSRVSDRVYAGPGGVYFVTSEQFVDSRGVAARRLYTVRQFNPETGNVNTAGEFNQMTSAAAHAAAARLAETPATVDA